MAADEGFFSRWSRRKAEATPAARPAPPSATAPQPVSSPAPSGTPSVGSAVPPPDAPLVAAEASRHALPTLADVAALTSDADFSRFVGRQVSAQVRNAALKKLFADPHFNVMDGLDIYIDDYSIPSPLDPKLLADMEAMKFLDRLPDPQPPAAEGAVSAMEPVDRLDPAGADHPSADAEPLPTSAALHTEPPEGLAPLTDLAPMANPPESPHDDADLQLQPDLAARLPGAG